MAVCVLSKSHVLAKIEAISFVLKASLFGARSLEA
jgi:hypothetical protein